MGSTLSVTHLRGLTSGSNANEILLDSGHDIVGSNAGQIRVPGMHLQVVHSEYKSSSVVASTSYTSVGHTITITPKYATSKILIEYHFNFGQFRSGTATQDNMKRFTIYSDAATTGTFLNIAPSGYYHFFQHQNEYGGAVNFDEQTEQASIKYLHSPNTTNPVTYQLRATCDNGSVVSISYNSRGYGSQTERGICNAFATEIAQ